MGGGGTNGNLNFFFGADRRCIPKRNLKAIEIPRPNRVNSGLWALFCLWHWTVFRRQPMLPSHKTHASYSRVQHPVLFGFYRYGAALISL